MRSHLASGVAALVEAGGNAPGLATVLIGDDPASGVDVRNKRRACTAAGMTDLHRHLPAETTQDDAGALIDETGVRPGGLRDSPAAADTGPPGRRRPACRRRRYAWRRTRHAAEFNGPVRLPSIRGPRSPAAHEVCGLCRPGSARRSRV
ncbi:tetrahydrofolate dehydrogenase/cyclohydrolase catalytic domain-containing protein [Streptomyces sp. ME08-AFT2]|uniref:tetrahydrofolate dehydrogenase/cyclohydrolase catalytic domain-containing protein n=1 Tax=Streptomyces sp. ME08-AFT2 TaxID=3028683 RepID=UPI0039F64FC0